MRISLNCSVFSILAQLKTRDYYDSSSSFFNKNIPGGIENILVLKSLDQYSFADGSSRNADTLIGLNSYNLYNKSISISVDEITVVRFFFQFNWTLVYCACYFQCQFLYLHLMRLNLSINMQPRLYFLQLTNFASSVWIVFLVFIMYLPSFNFWNYWSGYFTTYDGKVKSYPLDNKRLSFSSKKFLFSCIVSLDFTTHLV